MWIFSILPNVNSVFLREKKLPSWNEVPLNKKFAKPIQSDWIKIAIEINIRRNRVKTANWNRIWAQRSDPSAVFAVELGNEQVENVEIVVLHTYCINTHAVYSLILESTLRDMLSVYMLLQLYVMFNWCVTIFFYLFLEEAIGV